MAETPNSPSPAFLAMHAALTSALTPLRAFAAGNGDSSGDMGPHLDEVETAIALAEREAGRAALSAPLTATAAGEAEDPAEPNPAAVDRITAEILLKAAVRLRDFIDKGAMTPNALARLTEIERLILDAHRNLPGGAS